MKEEPVTHDKSRCARDSKECRNGSHSDGWVNEVNVWIEDERKIVQ